MPPGDTARLTYTAGIVSGLAAAVLCAFVAPLIVTFLLQGSLDALDLSIFAFQMLYSSVICVPTYAAIAVPMAIGGARVGLEIANARDTHDVRPSVWMGAVIGSILGYALCSLVAFGIGQTG